MRTVSLKRAERFLVGSHGFGCNNDGLSLEKSYD